VQRVGTDTASIGGRAALFASVVMVAAACSHPQTPAPAPPSHAATPSASRPAAAAADTTSNSGGVCHQVNQEETVCEWSPGPDLWAQPSGQP
jgi:hypothetical protein